MLTTYVNNKIKTYYYDFNSNNFINKTTKESQLHTNKLTKSLRDTVIQTAFNFAKNHNEDVMTLELYKRQFTCFNNIIETKSLRLI